MTEKGAYNKALLPMLCCTTTGIASVAALVESIIMDRNSSNKTAAFACWCSYFLISFICGSVWSNVSRMKGRVEKNRHNGKIIHREKMCAYYYTTVNISSAILALVIGAMFDWNERDLGSVLCSFFCANQIFVIGAVPLLIKATKTKIKEKEKGGATKTRIM